MVYFYTSISHNHVIRLHRFSIFIIVIFFLLSSSWIHPLQVYGSSRTPSPSSPFVIPLLFLLIAIGITFLIYKRLKRKSKKRRYFSAETIRETFKEQDYKCDVCRKGIIVSLRNYDKHHKDRNRSNNARSNCRLLCITCHAKINRGLLEKEEKKHLRWKRNLFVIIIFLIIVRIFWQLING